MHVFTGAANGTRGHVSVSDTGPYCKKVDWAALTAANSVKAGRVQPLNRELRTGRQTPPWPEHMFTIGRDGSGCASAIDLRDPLGPVWWADRCHLDAVGTAIESPSLAAWAEQHLTDLLVDLEEKGISDAAPPSARDKAEAESARAGCMFTLALAGVGALLVFAAWLVVRFLAP
jgi:hypothetical protein